MFADIPENTGNFRRKAYVTIKEGRPTMFQFLDEHPERFLVHTINTSDGRWVKLLHVEDSSLMNEEWFNQQYKPRWTYRVNVLDVTPYVINPITGTKINALTGNVPERDPVDGSSLRDIKPRPLNEVKILERGIKLFKQFNAVIQSLQLGNDDFDPRNVVFFLQASGSGMGMSITAFPRMDIAAQDISEFEPFDLDIPPFSDEEIQMMLRGTALMKIYEMRREAASKENLSGGFTAEGLEFGKNVIPGLG